MSQYGSVQYHLNSINLQVSTKHSLLLTSEAGVPGALCPDRLQQNEWASGHTCLLWCNPAPQRGAFPGI